MTVYPTVLNPLETAQNNALRVLLRAPLWTKCVCLRAEVYISSVFKRVTQLSVGHLATLLRHGGSEQLHASVGQALAQVPTYTSGGRGQLNQHHSSGPADWHRSSWPPRIARITRTLCLLLPGDVVVCQPTSCPSQIRRPYQHWRGSVPRP